MEQQSKYMVRVSCATYNHAPYIVDAMNGFTMQQTNFPFVCTIIDDASTDGEQKVIRRYLQEHFDLQDSSVAYEKDEDFGLVTFAQHKTNRNCYFAVIYLKENHYSQKKSKVPYIQDWADTKYIACCEGDDYWIDKEKLQRQIDFLNMHPDYMMCFHNALVRYQNHDRPDRLISNFKTGDFDTALLFEKWQLPLASVVFRKDVYDAPVLQKLRQVRSGGFTYFITASVIGKVYGIAECLSVYRKNDGGVSNKMSPAYCIEIDYGFAKASGDSQALKVMDKKAISALTGRILPYFRKNPEAVEMVRVVDSFNKKVFYRALWKYTLSIPVRIWKKL